MKAAITVHPVRGRRDRREFLNLPFRLFRNDPCWVAPLFSDMKEKLDRARHPFFRNGEAEFYLARRGNEVVGRVAALVNESHNSFHGEQAAGFGLIEFCRDAAVAEALIRTAAAWAREKGMTVLRGPYSFSTNEECGTLIEGFDTAPAVMMPYNPEWYPELLMAAGLRKARELLAYFVDESNDYSRMKRLFERQTKRESIEIRPIRVKEMEKEIALVRTIYNDAWERNWAFVPMSGEEFLWQAKKLKPVIVPKLALIAEKAGEPAAFSLTLPDLNQALIRLRGRLFPFGFIRFLREQRKITHTRVLTLGVRKKFRGIGLESMMIHKTVENGLGLGYGSAELSWILEDNVMMRRILEKMKARISKRYAIWEAKIEELVG